jgi:NAD+ synthase
LRRIAQDHHRKNPEAGTPVTQIIGVKVKFHKDILRIDCGAEADRICAFIRQQISAWRREGAVVGISGGIDSALAAALCARSLGKDKVLGLILPEKESDPVSAEYASRYAGQLGLNTVTIDITPVLDSLGTYRKRDEVIREIFPEYTSQYRSKITLPPDLLARDAFNFFSLKIEDDRGNVKSARLDSRSVQTIVAATNTKQRTRMIYLYYYAEMNNYLVCGTTNRSEDIQGYFVKYGDGGVDIEPLAHLYKMQVYQLAGYLGVPREIIEREPSPDTFSFRQSDEEFYFRMPYDILDLLLYAWENQVPLAEVCQAMALTEEQVKRAFRDFTSKASATKHLHTMPPALKQ